MCLSDKYLQILRELNESDFRNGRASMETYDRFRRLFARCDLCVLRENGCYGDALPDCRQDFLRLFISMKNDVERYLINGPIRTPGFEFDKDDGESDAGGAEGDGSAA